MRVFYICDIDLGVRDASVVHTMEVVENLSQLNVDITLFAPQIRKYNQKTLVKIRYLKVINKPVLWVISYQLTLFLSLIYFILKENPNIIYVRQSDLIISPFLVSHLLHIPLVTEINGDSEEEARLERGSHLRIKGLNVTEKTCYRLANKIITVTPVIKKIISARYHISPSKIAVVRNGVNTNLFRPLNVKKARKELKLKSDLFYVGFVGNLAVWQGVEYLIKSLPFVLQKIPKIKCLIIGEGTEKNKLESLVKNLKLEKNVIFTGGLPYHVVPKYINALDIGIVPFIKARSGKASPLKLYEYLSCSKAVIASNIKEIGDLFKDLVIVAEPENAKDLAKKIMMLIKNPQLRKQLGRKGRFFVLDGQSWRDVAYKVSDICQKVINDF